MAPTAIGVFFIYLAKYVQTDINGEILDSFVAEQTIFESWEEMFASATKALLISQLGF